MTQHPMTDEFIAQRWPDNDTPDGREEIRLQFDALMDQINRSSVTLFPRWPDAMAAVVIEKTRTLPDRINGLKAALAGIPPHLLKYQWKADERPHFGNKSVRVEPTDIAGDDGHGFGRQWIARVNHVSKNYVGTLANFIAAANPDTVGMMIARIEHLESILTERSADAAEAHRMDARFEAEALANRAGIDIGDDRHMFIDDLAETLNRFSARPVAPAQPDIAALETQLKHLITTRPKKAALAAVDDDMRMWFVAQLTGTASGRVPLTEIEAMVSRHLMAVPVPQLPELFAQTLDAAIWEDEDKLTPEEAWTILCETPDITSPAEYPDHALITLEQLRNYMERAHAAPEGWQIVPKEPTGEMKTAGLKTTGMPENTYRDMLAAARGEAIDEDAWL